MPALALGVSVLTCSLNVLWILCLGAYTIVLQAHIHKAWKPQRSGIDKSKDQAHLKPTNDPNSKPIPRFDNCFHSEISAIGTQASAWLKHLLSTDRHRPQLPPASTPVPCQRQSRQQKHIKYQALLLSEPRQASTPIQLSLRT